MALKDRLDKSVAVTIAGGSTPDGAPLACTIAPADLRTVMEYAQQGVTAVHLVYSAADLGAGAGDHVTIDGVTYPVVAARSFSNDTFGPAVYVTICGAAE